MSGMRLVLSPLEILTDFLLKIQDRVHVAHVVDATGRQHKVKGEASIHCVVHPHNGGSLHPLAEERSPCQEMGNVGHLELSPPLFSTGALRIPSKVSLVKHMRGDLWGEKGKLLSLCFGKSVPEVSKHCDIYCISKM